MPTSLGLIGKNDGPMSQDLGLLFPVRNGSTGDLLVPPTLLLLGPGAFDNLLHVA